MIKALLFDLGGVLIDIRFSRIKERWAQHAKRLPSGLNWHFAFDDYYRQHELGAISAEVYLAHLRKQLEIDITDDQMLDGWNAIFGGVIPGVPELLEKARQEYPLYVFSNSNAAHEKYFAKQYEAVLQNFNRIFVSSTIGLRKPDPAAFHFVANAIGMKPSEIAFFDDTRENTEAARNCEMQSHLISGPSDLERAVSALLSG